DPLVLRSLLMTSRLLLHQSLAVCHEDPAVLLAAEHGPHSELAPLRPSNLAVTSAFWDAQAVQFLGNAGGGPSIVDKPPKHAAHYGPLFGHHFQFASLASGIWNALEPVGSNGASVISSQGRRLPS